MKEYDGLWLKKLAETLPPCGTPAETARAELTAFFAGRGVSFRLAVDKSLGEGYRVRREGERWTVTGGDTGVLYGAYDLISALITGESADGMASSPRYPLRMLNGRGVDVHVVQAEHVDMRACQ